MALQSEGLDPPSQGWRRGIIRSGRLTAPAVVVVAALGLALALITTVVLNRPTWAPEVTLYVLLADLAYIILLIALIVWRVVALIGAQRSKSAGAALHLRLTGIFAIVAVLPTIIVAMFATVSLYLGFEATFSERVRLTVNNAQETAEAYAQEQRKTIQGDVFSYMNEVNRAGRAFGGSLPALTDLLRSRQQAYGFAEAFLTNGAREIIAGFSSARPP